MQECQFATGLLIRLTYDVKQEISRIEGYNNTTTYGLERGPPCVSLCCGALLGERRLERDRTAFRTDKVSSIVFFFEKLICLLT